MNNNPTLSLEDRLAIEEERSAYWRNISNQFESENAELREQVRRLKMDLDITRQRRCHQIVSTEAMEMEIDQLREDRERLYAILAKYERKEAKE